MNNSNPEYYTSFLPKDLKTCHGLIMRFWDKIAKLETEVRELKEYKWMYESLSR